MASTVRWLVLVLIAAGWARRSRAMPRREARPARVAIVLDAATDANERQAARLEEELVALVGAKALRAERRGPRWCAPRATLDALTRAADIDAIVAVGPVGSLLVQTSAASSKPRVAAFVLDSALGRGPSMVALAPSIEAQTRHFESVAELSRPALLLDRRWIAALPDADAWTKRVGREVGTEIALVAVDGDAAAALDALPAGVDAAVLGPLLGLADDELARVVEGLTRRGLPTLSLLGEEHVEAGALVGLRSDADERARVRRAALALERGLRGDRSGGPPAVRASGALHLNVATAERLDIALPTALLVRSVLIGSVDAGNTSSSEGRVPRRTPPRWTSPTWRARWSRAIAASPRSAARSRRAVSARCSRLAPAAADRRRRPATAR